MITLNGRFNQDNDNFTVLSTGGRSVVDYAIVQSVHFNNFEEFEVATMLNLIEHLPMNVDSSIPDHSLLLWKYNLQEAVMNVNWSQLVNNDSTTGKTKQVKGLQCQPGKPLFKPDSKKEQALEALIQELDILIQQESTEQMQKDYLENNYNTFYSIIESEFAKGKSHYRSTKKPWWNVELEALRKELRESQNNWIKTNNPSEKNRLWHIYKNRQKQFNQCIRRVKRKFQREKQQYFLLTKATNVKKFWKAFEEISIANNRTNKGMLPHCVMNSDGSLTSDKYETSQAWLDHFRKTFNPLRNCADQTDPHCTSDSTIDDYVLNGPITLEEVETAIAHLEDGKAPGLDGICPSLLKNGKITRYLHNLFQACFSTGTVPHAWLGSIIQPIYKGSGNKLDPNNYRGITLQSCVAKAFCKVLNNRLSLYLETNNVLHEEQNGFRKQRNCQDQIFSLYCLIENRKLDKLDTYACFVDFRKAFDSIPRDRLWQKMARNGINDQMLHCIKALYTNTYSRIKINNELTGPLKIDRGVKQGCTLSPTLFNIYINDLIDCLKQESNGLRFGECNITALLYADDLVILGDSPSTLQKLLDALDDWCKHNGMVINPDKTKVVHFRHNRKEICQTAFSCGETLIGYTNCYKYLGVEFTEHLSWTKLIECTSISASRAASYLIAKMRCSGAFSYTVYTYLCNTLILPIIEYSSFIWGFRIDAKITKIQNNLMRSFLGVSRNAPIASLLGDMGWIPISTITKISCIRYWLRLKKMAPTRLNYQIYTHTCNLAYEGYHNWASRVGKLMKLESNTDVSPAADCSDSLTYYKAALISLTKKEWQEDINQVNEHSESGGRLNLYRKMKLDVGVEEYIVNSRSIGERRVVAGLRMGCLPLAIETGRYNNTPVHERLCRLCGRGEVEDQIHFLTICPIFDHIRIHLLNHCMSLDPSFHHYSPQMKTKFILCQCNVPMTKLILQMYNHRQHTLYHN